MCDASRWYYNTALSILNLEAYRTKSSISELIYSLRDILNKYVYSEREQINTGLYGNKYIMCIQSLLYNEENNSVPINPNIGVVHNRIPRGSVLKLIYAFKSALSNLKNGNISQFELKFVSKKHDKAFSHFEDSSFPKILTKIKSRYFYKSGDRKRGVISFKDIFNNTKKRGVELIHDKLTDKFYLHYPVEYDWRVEEVIKNDNQGLDNSSPSIISLDPGVRKFLVGYDPDGKLISFGDGASLELTRLLLMIDKEPIRSIQKKLWRRIKNLVTEVHNKTIAFLINYYDIILLPDFRVQGMIKGRKISRMTKRLMMMFRFHEFKEKLKWKCEMNNKKLIIVDESFTSKTCGRCGCLNDVKGSETYVCMSCSFIVDRDENGARNIFIKNVSLKSPYAIG
jgi:IS605 OrfB family transposase